MPQYTDRELPRIAMRRHIPAVAWVLGILLVLVGFWWRAPSSTAIAVREMNLNHLITADDLQTKESAALIGHYLRQSVKSGDPLTASMVSTQPSPAKFGNTIAAVVTIKRQQLGNIVIGSFVRIYRDSEAFGPAGRVIAIDCNEQTCSVIISLPRTPARTIDPDWFANVELVPAQAAPAASGL